MPADWACVASENNDGVAVAIQAASVVVVLLCPTARGGQRYQRKLNATAGPLKLRLSIAPPKSYLR